ncbi:MAG: PVC-type heme-binding CxxCH protein [Planctomycetales bacterium]
MLAHILLAAACLAADADEDAPLDAQLAARRAIVPDGFRVSLFAAEPMVMQPISFCIDDRGRVWVAEAFNYPVRGQEPKDRILCLEDTDGDGRADKRTVFFDKLGYVTGVEVGFGGVWVMSPPELLFIPDADGDAVPDGPPRVLLDGFGHQPSAHNIANGFTWGPDGWLYAGHGRTSPSDVGKPGTPAAERIHFDGGVYRYHPTRHVFEGFSDGTTNPWGVDFDDYGQAFTSNCVDPHLYHMIQGGHYEPWRGRPSSRYAYRRLPSIADHAHWAGATLDGTRGGKPEQLAVGGGHAHCGILIYLGDNWPDRYRNTAFLCNVHGRRINHDLVERRGSGYTAGHGRDLFVAADPWFMGVTLETGPAGDVFVSDWNDTGECHSYRNTRRDTGRIFRISYGEPQPFQVDVAKLSNDELVALQLHKNDWHVRHARRVLHERAAAGGDMSHVHEKCRAMFRDHPDVTRKLRALWVLHVTGRVDEPWLRGQLVHESEYVRAWCVRLLCERLPSPPSQGGAGGGSSSRTANPPPSHRPLPAKEGEQSPALADFERMAASDPSPFVRLHLASALQRLPLDERWGIARGLLAHDEDNADANLPLMAWYGIEPLVPANPAKALELGFASKLHEVRRYVVRRAAADPRGLHEVLASLGKTDDIARRKLMLAEVVQAVRPQSGLQAPAGWDAVYATLEDSDDATVREQAQFVTVKFGDRSIFPALRKIVADPLAKTASRRTALDTLLEGKDAELPPVLVALLDDAELRGAALRGLARYDSAETPGAILARYSKLDADEKGDAVATLASRPPYALALLDAIGNGDVPRSDLSAFTVRQLQQFDEPALVKKLNDVWGTIRTTTEAKRRRIFEHKARLTPDALALADLARGRLLFENTCAKCHRMFGAGGEIGPDITGSQRTNLDYILENILDPSAIVEREYQMTTLLLADGRALSGLIAEENESAIVLHTLNEPLVVPKRDVEQRVASSVSIMPDGQLDPMRPDEVRDLIAYLAAPWQVPRPGQVPPLDERTGQVRGAIEGETLRTLAVSRGRFREQRMENSPDARFSRSRTGAWTGARPDDTLTLALPVRESGRYELFASFARGPNQATVRLTLDDTPLARGPLDLHHPEPQPTGPLSLGTHELSAGDHRLTIKIEGANSESREEHQFALDYLYLAPLDDAPPTE